MENKLWPVFLPEYGRQMEHFNNDMLLTIDRINDLHRQFMVEYEHLNKLSEEANNAALKEWTPEEIAEAKEAAIQHNKKLTHNRQNPTTQLPNARLFATLERIATAKLSGFAEGDPYQAITAFQQWAADAIKDQA